MWGGPGIFLGSGTLKKWVQNMGCKKQGAKNRFIVIQKEKRQPVLFWFFSGSQTNPFYKKIIVGVDGLGESVSWPSVGAVQIHRH